MTPMPATKPSPPPATAHDATLTSLAQINKAAADGLRLQILQVLKAESFGVLELCEIFELAQPKLSHHLKVLLNAGLVATRRDGNSIFYRRPLLLIDTPFNRHIQHLFATLDHLELAAEIYTRIDSIKTERARSSLDFFTKNANKFSEKQALVAEKSQYVANLRELVSATDLPDSATVLEVGPGEGEFICELATQFKQAIALDNSEAMLCLAQGRAQAQGIDNITFMLGEPAGFAAESRIRGDLVICNMVLHHIASPAETFKHMAQLLNPHGYLLLAELSHHNQEWVRQSCGDLWLGFETEELTHWAGIAGMKACQSLYLALRNGFQVQLHLFQKSTNEAKN